MTRKLLLILLVEDMDEDDIFLMRLLDGETDSPSPGSSGTPVDPDDDVARDPDWTEDDEDEEYVKKKAIEKKSQFPGKIGWTTQVCMPICFLAG